MQTKEKDVLNDVFCSVLEKLAFMFGDPVEKEDLPEAGEKYLEARIDFAGVMSGDLTLAAPADICVEISANILGVDEDDVPAMGQSDDALRELLNITCGNLVTAMAGEEAVFDLSPPVVRPIDPDGWRMILDDEDTLAFDVDSNPVLLRLHKKG